MNTIEEASLYIVATPIGNLEDITLRALRILKEVDVIACEDTRHSLKLLNHYEIKNKLITYHSYNQRNSAPGIVQLLAQGKSVALISDSGTPAISDPGVLLVKAAREAGFSVVPIPGPSACISLLSVSGFRTDRFFFHGFLSIKRGKRQTQLKEMIPNETTHILYESPHRLIKLLEDIAEIFPEKDVSIGKEITKMNEIIVQGKAVELISFFETNKIAGEFVLLIANYKKK